MSEKDKFIFLRNDDVRGELDHELVELTQCCIKQQVPITHAVEPANLSLEVVEWLQAVKMQFPHLIEIVQHGYDHNCKNPSQKMEFGGNRDLFDQLNSIRLGKELMNKYFGDLWSPVFTFPYGTFNNDTLKALEIEGYKAISSKIDYTSKSLLKNTIGKLFKKNFILGKKINFHPNKRGEYGFYEFSVSANLIKKYTGNNSAFHYSESEIISQINRAQKHTNIIGILFHHRFHTNHIEMTNSLLIKLKENGYNFSTIMNLIR